MRLTVVEDGSLVGRIHEMIADMQHQGRMSCAEASAVWALTMNPDLPDYFRSVISSPQYSPQGSTTDGLPLPLARGPAASRRDPAPFDIGGIAVRPSA